MILDIGLLFRDVDSRMFREGSRLGEPPRGKEGTNSHITLSLI